MIWATDPTVFGETSLDTVRCNATIISLSAMGLKPLTRHRFYIDGVDYTWACRGFGQNLGDELVSARDGKLRFQLLYEFKYEGNYSFDTVSSDQSRINTGTQSQQIDTKSNYVKTTKFMEIKAPGSYTYINYPIRIAITAGHINRAQSHGH